MAEEYNELVSNMSDVEETLVEYAAEKSIDESVLGEVAVGTVENVLLESVYEAGVVVILEYWKL